MQCKTSLFNPTLVKTDWKHYWPLFFGYSFVMLIVLPFSIRSELLDNSFYTLMSARALARSGIYASMGLSVVLACIFCIMFAMAVFSYLYNARAIDLMHALPIRREAQFISHCFSALSMMTVGNMLSLLGAVIMLAVNHIPPMGALIRWFFVVEAAEVFFFGLAALCAQVTGWLLAVPVIYCGLNCVVYAIAEVVKSTASDFYYGYSFPQQGPLENWLTPLAKMCSSLTQYRIWDEEYTNWYCQMPEDASVAMWAYFIVGIVFLGIAFLFHRSRRSESAGDAIAFRFVRVIALYVIGLTGALGIGLVLYTMIGKGGIGILLFFQLIAGLICWFGVEMLLHKEFHVFTRKAILGAAVLCICIGTVTACIGCDVTGYVLHVPDAAEVESISMYDSRVPGSGLITEKDTIAAVTELHQLIAAQGTASSDEEYATGWFSLEYKLKDGSYLSRNYEYYIIPDSSTHRAINALANTREMRAFAANENTLSVIQDTADILGGSIFASAEADENVWNRYGSTIYLTAEEANQLADALLKDAALNGSLDVLCGLDMQSVSLELYVNNSDLSYWATIRPDFENTWTVLEELGLLDRQTAYAVIPPLHG